MKKEAGNGFNSSSSLVSSAPQVVFAFIKQPLKNKDAVWGSRRACGEGQAVGGGSRAPAQGGHAQTGFALLEHPAMCYPP